jgi:tetratricopeptide (TPR) repeat protein
VNLSRIIPVLFLFLETCAIAQTTKTARQIYDSASPSVFLVRANDSSGKPNLYSYGTCFEVAPRTLVTNAHVVAGGSPVLIVDETRVPVQIVNIDSLNDLAILTVDNDLPSPSAPLALSVQQPLPGDEVFAIGNPDLLQKSISQGIVSATRNLDDGRTLLQITSPISHGSSGGPILNDQGEVIAVTVSTRNDGQNLNFAVPVTYLRELLKAKPNSLSATLTPAGLHDLVLAFKKEQFSLDPGSPAQQRLEDIRRAIRLAAHQTNDSSELSQLMCMGYNTTPDDDGDAVADVARKYIASVKGTSGEAHAVIAYELSYEAERLSSGPALSHVLQEGESEADISLKMGGRGTATAEYAKGILLYIRKSEESLPLLHKVLTEDPKLFACGYNLRAYTYRHLITISQEGIQSDDETERYFQALIATGEAVPSDWAKEGSRRNARKDFVGAAAAFEQVELTHPIDACTVARNYSLARGDYSEKILTEGKRCFEASTNFMPAPGVDLSALLGEVHLAMASVLNDRGAYTEALSHSQDGIALYPKETNLLYEEARALEKLGRTQECIATAQRAVATTNVQNAQYELQLGICYFDAFNWGAAAASFREAAKNSADATAAYRLALSLKKQGNTTEATAWFQEALRRRPDEHLRAEILASQR